MKIFFKYNSIIDSIPLIISIKIVKTMKKLEKAIKKANYHC